MTAGLLLGASGCRRSDIPKPWWDLGLPLEVSACRPAVVDPVDRSLRLECDGRAEAWQAKYAALSKHGWQVEKKNAYTEVIRRDGVVVEVSFEQLLVNEAGVSLLRVDGEP